MKKLILTSTIWFVASVTLAQGTINFSNLSTALSSPPDRLVRFGSVGGGPMSPGTPASTNVYPGLVAQLFYGSSTADEASLVPVSNAPGTLRSSTSASVGTWFGNGWRTLTVIGAGDMATLQVRVWDITKGTDYNLAIADSHNYAGATGNYFGASALFFYEIATHTSPDPIWQNMYNFLGFSLQFVPVPEPHPITLCASSLVSLIIAWQRRTKRSAHR